MKNKTLHHIKKLKGGHIETTTPKRKREEPTLLKLDK
jgi:hypothetical protein